MRDRHPPDSGQPAGGLGWTSAAKVDEVLAGLDILVVDDEALIVLEMEALLRDAGARVVGPALCLEDALALIKGADQRISLAILDVRLGGDSIAPVAQLLTERGTSILFYSGQMADDPVLARFPNSDFLAKPCAAGALVAKLSELSRRAEPQV